MRLKGKYSVWKNIYLYKRKQQTFNSEIFNCTAQFKVYYNCGQKKKKKQESLLNIAN